MSDYMTMADLRQIMAIGNPKLRTFALLNAYHMVEVGSLVEDRYVQSFAEMLDAEEIINHMEFFDPFSRHNHSGFEFTDTAVSVLVEIGGAFSSLFVNREKSTIYKMAKLFESLAFRGLRDIGYSHSVTNFLSGEVPKLKHLLIETVRPPMFRSDYYPIFDLELESLTLQGLDSLIECISLDEKMFKSLKDLTFPRCKGTLVFIQEAIEGCKSLTCSLHVQHKTGNYVNDKDFDAAIRDAEANEVFSSITFH